MEQINLSYSIPIEVTESLDENETKDFLIQGIAINSTVTDNQHKFLSEELELAAGSLMNKPLLKDHDNSTDSIVGKVILAEYDPISESVRFKARINQTEQGKKIRELIKSGDLNTVSIGANVNEMDEEDGILVPKGIKFKELSVVAVPADDSAVFTFNGANFALALSEAYKKAKESQSPSLEDSKQIKKEDKMEKDETKVESKSEENLFEEKLALQDKKLDAHTKVLEEVLKGLNTLQEKLEESKVKEADADEVEEPKEEVEEPKEEPKEEVEVEEPKAEESDEAEEEEEEELDLDEKGKYKIVQKYKSFTVERKYR